MKITKEDHKNSLERKKYIKRTSVVLGKLIGVSLIRERTGKKRENKDNEILSMYINGKQAGLGGILYFT